ncbi:MAG: hypothetical protein H0T45_01545 [Pyrinomonadaceae bacterium]|nr:hypothetical protein [Pyrinomonadaceae bacterium]
MKGNRRGKRQPHVSSGRERGSRVSPATRQTAEGRWLDYATADEMQRALHATLRDLEQLTLTLAVMERQVR